MFTIGRFNLDDTQNHDAVQWRWNGDVLDVDGNITADTLHDAKALRRQLLGYPTPEEPVVKVTSTLDAEIDGYYEVLSTSSELLDAGESYRANLFPFQAALRRIPHSAAAITETLIIGAVRANDHGLDGTDVRPWHAVPNSVRGYGPAFDDMQSFTVDDAQGNTIRIYDSDVAGDHYLGPARHLWRANPADFYQGAARIQTAQTFAEADAGLWHDLVGLEARNTPVWWRLTNDLVTITPGGALDVDSGELDVSWWDPGDEEWWTKTFLLGVNGGLLINNRAHSFMPLRNTAHVCAVRLGLDVSDVTGGVDDVAALDLTLRRGSRVVEGHLSLYTIETGVGYTWQLATSAAEATTFVDASNSARRASANDANGNRFVLMCPDAHDEPAADDGIALTGASTEFRFGIGMEVDGTSAAEPWRVADLVAQYYAAQSEEVRVSPP